MLVLSRKQQQSIVIDSEIKVTVVRVRGNTVRLAIEAPRNVPIRRQELAPLETCETTPAPTPQLA